LLNVDTSSTRPRNMVNFGFGLRLRSVGEFGEPLQISTGFASWQRYSSSGHQLNFAALNRGRHLYSAVRPSRWALAHILVLHILTVTVAYRTQALWRVIAVAHDRLSDSEDFYVWVVLFLWSSYGIGQTIIFSSCGFFLSIFYLLFFLA